MDLFEVELRRTSYLIYKIEACDEETAEELAYERAIADGHNSEFLDCESVEKL